MSHLIDSPNPPPPRHSHTSAPTRLPEIRPLVLIITILSNPSQHLTVLPEYGQIITIMKTLMISLTHPWSPDTSLYDQRETGKERVKNLITGTNPLLSSWEQLGLSAFPPGNSCCFISMNGKQNFDFLIDGVINLPSRLRGDESLCEQVGSLILDPTRCSI